MTLSNTAGSSSCFSVYTKQNSHSNFHPQTPTAQILETFVGWGVLIIRQMTSFPFSKQNSSEHRKHCCLTAMQESFLEYSYRTIVLPQKITISFVIQHRELTDNSKLDLL